MACEILDLPMFAMSVPECVFSTTQIWYKTSRSAFGLIARAWSQATSHSSAQCKQTQTLVASSSNSLFRLLGHNEHQVAESLRDIYETTRDQHLPWHWKPSPPHWILVGTQSRARHHHFSDSDNTQCSMFGQRWATASTSSKDFFYAAIQHQISLPTLNTKSQCQHAQFTCICSHSPTSGISFSHVPERVFPTTQIWHKTSRSALFKNIWTISDPLVLWATSSTSPQRNVLRAHPEPLTKHHRRHTHTIFPNNYYDNRAPWVKSVGVMAAGLKQ